MSYALFYVGVVFVLYVFYVIVFKLIRIVKHNEVMIIEKWGRYKETLTPGLHFLIPFIETPRVIHWRYPKARGSQIVVARTVTDRIDMREQVIEFGKQLVISRDLVSVDVDALVYYQITDPKLAVLSIQNLPDAIELLTQSTLRNIIAHLTLDDTFSSRELINDELLAQINPDCNRWGVTVHRCEIFNISPPSEIQRAMESQVTEERERRSTVIIADGNRESAIIESRGTVAEIVLRAEGLKAEKTIIAKGLAQAKTMVALSEAKSIDFLREAIDVVGVRATDYLLANEYLKSIRSMGVGEGTWIYLIPQSILKGIRLI